MAHARVLVIDDEPDILDLLSMTLKRMDLDPDTASDLGEAREKLLASRFDLCLTDMKLPDGDGLDLVEWMQTHAPSVPVAVITAHGNVEAAVRALKLGAFDFVSKPVRVGDLRKMVQTALRLDRSGTRPAGEPPEGGLIGQSEAMAKVRRMIAKVARSQAPVYIFGESGTGKELVAKLIHESGPRASGPFVPVNCGAIPTELMESEFFGHRKGSFTGAVDDKEGLIRRAEGGTLFLDEVGDLPLHMQVKLLRVIQERAVRPVGDTKEIPVDVRFLSASHKDLAALVAEGEFREDLYYRINVIDLRVPPLRERGEDIILLANYFLEQMSRTMDIPVPEISPEAEERMVGHGFPGNVRELENVLERALTMADSGRIEAEDIELRGGPAKPASSGTVAPGEAPLESQLKDMEREAIVQALEQTRYNKTAAAKLLGISFRQLRYRIKKLDLE
jgi:two-component system response regulator PilR (NtrC family)